MQRRPEDVLKLCVARNLPANILDGAAKICLKLAQCLAGPFELFGKGLTLMLDERELAHARMGLAQVNPRFLRQNRQLLAGPLNSFASVGNITFFGCTVVVSTSPFWYRLAPLPRF